MKSRLAMMLVGAGLMGALAALPANAQQDNGGGNGGGGGGGAGGGPGGGGGGRRGGGAGGGGGGFGQRMQQRMDQMKDEMGASDDEWKALEPKITALQQSEMQQMMGRLGGGRGGRGGAAGGGGGNGGGGGGFPGAPTPTPAAQAVQTATADLQNVLQNKDATPDQIKSKLDALRNAKKKAGDELKKQQDDLKGLLTVRQEAVLVSHGILE
jgi:hypothetical protein